MINIDESLEIHSLEIDFDNNKLIINGKPVTDKPVIVALPGPAGWPFQKLFNAKLAPGCQEDCDRLTVTYVKANSMLLPAT